MAMQPGRRIDWTTTALVLTLLGVLPTGLRAEAPDQIKSFIANHCLDCHSGSEAEANLDLTSLDASLNHAHDVTKWVRIHDRVHAGEMPPEESSTASAEEMKLFAKRLSQWLQSHQHAKQKSEGRVRGRRLTRLQMERTLHDLLGIDIPLADKLPEEPRTDSFSTVAEDQTISHFHLDRHLHVVDVALDEAFQRALGQADSYDRTLDAKTLCRRNPRRRTREPELIDDRAVTWSSGVTFYGRLPATTAPESGWYRFVIRANALNCPEGHGVWCTVRRGLCVSSAPLLPWVGAIEATEDPKTWTFETWLPKGHMLEIRPGDTTLKRGRFAGGQVGTGEGAPQNVPGVAIESIHMTRIHQGMTDEQIRHRLLDDLTIKPGKKGKPGTVVSTNPDKDLARLIKRFAHWAFRRPVTEEEVAPYVAMAIDSMSEGNDFASTLRTGYRSLLCSPRFLLFQEEPGPLDQYAIANRLSYLLWSSMPDRELLQLAEKGELSDPNVLRAQVRRMLDSPRGKQFVRDFAAEWLDLGLIDFTQPDRRLFPRFDPIVQQSMLAETHAYLDDMVRENKSVTWLIDSDYTFLDSRLARYYGIDGVEGDEIRKVSLEPGDHRGGLLTQGAILKVTANGTNTSPIIRGIWVSERILGVPIPPPPENVPAVEPDIRGAKTIREMLAKHRSQESCAVCHRSIDPPGFALENYDAAGLWRDQYLQKSGRRVRRGAKVDASYDMADGRHFEDVDQFQTLVLEDRQGLARNVVDKLITFGTGAEVAFADRDDVEAIAAQAASSDYGMRSLIEAVVTSPIFLTK
ncbi:Planctomycete cytochrome C [Planctomycetes bacterium Pan216]|uniref:Planctomycete cytochrome C n=1 Tax=Kolteria novifilia TaxID=2527975 RepID=A0A518BAF3_9BACT|nr:Planctomycete cytochrome C [Planctomycetes bacterium Pan216]